MSVTRFGAQGPERKGKRDGIDGLPSGIFPPTLPPLPRPRTVSEKERDQGTDRVGTGPGLPVLDNVQNSKNTGTRDVGTGRTR